MYRYENFEYPEDVDSDGTVYYYGGERIRSPYWVRDNLPRSSGTPGSYEIPPPVEDVVTPPLPLTPGAPAEELQNVLIVKDVDLHIKENTTKHRTDDFACTTERDVDDKPRPAELVIRRGDSVKITVVFDKPYSKENHEIKLRFTIGERPVVAKGTLAELEIEEAKTEINPDEWKATLEDKRGDIADIIVHVPASCIVGEWNFSITETVNKGKDENGKDKLIIFQYNHKEDVKILFNPWCKDDGVYMDNGELLEEYILNESGCLFRGDAYNIDALDWNFGQFQENILESALYLLRRGFKDGISYSMAYPVTVSRTIAKMVNSSDDKGVLTGRWSGNYSDGRSPMAWVGSVKILQQWLNTGLPVRYGQCWVFSGVTTTVCRALGIPCRSVTNFNSAHDTDGSNTIDEYYRNGEKMDSYRSDSVWNFHVWNEVWMHRPDLKDYPYGWQVIDATPQEMSDGVYQCGPCPVLAVRRGDVDVSYDAQFVWSEVGSDIVGWERLPGKVLKRIFIKKNDVGQKISTKTPTGEPFTDETFGKEGWRFDLDAYIEKRRLDLTLDYKPKEGTEEEREVVYRAHKKAKKAKPRTYEGEIKTRSVEFRLRHSHKTEVGDDLKIELTAQNKGNHDRQISGLNLTVAPKTYTGATGKAFFKKQFDTVTVKKGEEIICYKALITPEMYLPYLVELGNVLIVATAKAEEVAGEKEDEIYKIHTVPFRRPVLKVKCQKIAKKGEKVKFEVSLINPLDIELTECDISMECNGFESFVDRKLSNVPPKGEYKDIFILEALRTKRHAVMFSFDCKQLKDVSGSGTVYVELN